jgi:HAD superfamily phosphatase (TIGR01668 family)
LKSLRTGGSAFATFFQVAPHLLKVIRRMRPTWHLPSLAALDAEFIRRHGVKGLIWDVDGTLTGDRRCEILPAAAPAFAALTAIEGLRHVVLSNAGEERYLQLGGIFPALPILRAYRLGNSVLYRRLVGRDDSWSAAELERRLAEGARVIRKPSPELVQYALRELGCAKDEAVMVGDQFMTDVAGANLGGVRSVKLPTVARDSFRVSVKVSQRLELAVYRLLYGPTDGGVKS